MSISTHGPSEAEAFGGTVHALRTPLGLITQACQGLMLYGTPTNALTITGRKPPDGQSHSKQRRRRDVLRKCGQHLVCGDFDSWREFG